VTVFKSFNCRLLTERAITRARHNQPATGLTNEPQRIPPLHNIVLRSSVFTIIMTAKEQ